MSAKAFPFNEYEKRFLLAEIIRVSNVSLETLQGVIRDEQVEPNWGEVHLPPARSVKDCQAAFQELFATAAALPLYSGQFQPLPPTSRKRRLSDTEPSSASTRTIQPKPAPNGDGLASVRSASDTFPRKRGRPTKEVLEARKAEAALRGMVYPPLKAAGRKSSGATPGGQVSMGLEGPASEPAQKTGGNGDTPTKKRRGRPTKEEAFAKKMMSLRAQAIEAAQAASPTNQDVEVFHHSADELEVVDSAPEVRYVITTKGGVHPVALQVSGPAPSSTPPQQPLGHS